MKILLLEKPLSKAHINILCNVQRIFYLLLTANFQEDPWTQATREDDPTSPQGLSGGEIQDGGTARRDSREVTLRYYWRKPVFSSNSTAAWHESRFSLSQVKDD